MWSLVTVYQQADRSPAAALSTTDMHCDCTVFVCTCARVHIKAFCVYPLYP